MLEKAGFDMWVSVAVVFAEDPYIAKDAANGGLVGYYVEVPITDVTDPLELSVGLLRQPS